MLAISPRLASELAEIVYGVMQPGATGTYKLTQSPELDKHFSFDLSKGPINGSSGGFLGLYRKTSGFAVIGHGKGPFQNHHVITMRGTKSLHDGLTDLNVGFSVAHNRSAVHAGFNQTFQSMQPIIEKQLSPTLKSTGIVHCVGHSLGGALASLTADWVKARYRCPVNLYTFGSPRVGLDGFATKTTFGIDNIYRCTHGADPVPKVPLWPFTHAPNSGAGEFRLDSGLGISVAAHGMGESAHPGYRNTAKGQEWSNLRRSSAEFLNQPVRLKYENRFQASFSGQWADRINAALITLLKDAGYYQAVVTQAAISTTLTFYDMVSQTLQEVAKSSLRFARQTAGLLGHMLVFAGHAMVAVSELTYQFIRWVFDKTLGSLYRSVNQALNNLQ
ncbi:lipase family protein [Marinobacter caseinilyticus]|uniref:lipase family protein n=1 Tax=Marinobacter caseinilyticus TaxID=2692195 RepID=UPI001407FC46|nr:lipase family protein [Marinobacter caseinilyticus]